MAVTRILTASAATLLAFTVGCASPKGSTEPAGNSAAPGGSEPAAAPAAGETLAAPAATTAAVGQPAPNFKLTDTDGKEVQLADFRGKKVVLEWYNPECPFVKYAHGEGGPLASLPARYIGQGVVWLAINSGAEGKEGAGLGTNQKYKTHYNISYPVLMDPTGEVGRTYGAKTTPHMFVIDEQGTLVYMGALDNAPRGELQGDAPVNYIDQVFAELGNGGKVSTGLTKPYGCSVKYAS